MKKKHMRQMVCQLQESYRGLRRMHDKAMAENADLRQRLEQAEKQLMSWPHNMREEVEAEGAVVDASLPEDAGIPGAHDKHGALKAAVESFGQALSDQQPEGDLPAGLSWDDAPKLADSIGIDHTGIGGHFWMNEFQYQYADDLEHGIFEFGIPNRCRGEVTVIATRPQPAEQVQTESQPGRTTAPARYRLWHKWGGGECPVGKRENLVMRFRSGYYNSIPLPAAWFYWDHKGSGEDIIAYRLAYDPIRS